MVPKVFIERHEMKWCVYLIFVTQFREEGYDFFELYCHQEISGVQIYFIVYKKIQADAFLSEQNICRV